MISIEHVVSTLNRYSLQHGHISYVLNICSYHPHNLNVKFHHGNQYISLCINVLANLFHSDSSSNIIESCLRTGSLFSFEKTIDYTDKDTFNNTNEKSTILNSFSCTTNPNTIPHHLSLDPLKQLLFQAANNISINSSLYRRCEVVLSCILDFQKQTRSKTKFNPISKDEFLNNITFSVSCCEKDIKNLDIFLCLFVAAANSRKIDELVNPYPISSNNINNPNASNNINNPNDKNFHHNNNPNDISRYIINNLPPVNSIISQIKSFIYERELGKQIQIETSFLFKHNTLSLINYLISSPLKFNLASLTKKSSLLSNTINTTFPSHIFDISLSPDPFFEKMCNEYGCFIAYHGSPSENWWRILHHGLENRSGTKLQKTGSAFGSGIYLTDDVHLAKIYTDNSNIGDWVCKHSSIGSKLTIVTSYIVADVPNFVFYSAIYKNNNFNFSEMKMNKDRIQVDPRINIQKQKLHNSTKNHSLLPHHYILVKDNFYIKPYQLLVWSTHKRTLLRAKLGGSIMIILFIFILLVAIYFEQKKSILFWFRKMNKNFLPTF